MNLNPNMFEHDHDDYGMHKHVSKEELKKTFKLVRDLFIQAAVLFMVLGFVIGYDFSSGKLDPYQFAFLFLTAIITLVISVKVLKDQPWKRNNT